MTTHHETTDDLLVASPWRSERSAFAARPTRLREPSPIRALVEQGRIEEARLAAKGHPTWERLLAPSVATTSPATGRGDFLANRAWMKSNADTYRGSWVALRDGKLVLSASALQPLVDQLRATGTDAFVAKVEK